MPADRKARPRRPPRNLEEYTSLADAAAFCRQMAADLEEQSAALPDTKVKVSINFNYWPGLPAAHRPASWT